MEKIQGIKIREAADLGPVIARADHRDRAIEVNRKIFYGLPPMAQEFVLCHELCHLRYDDHDEARTNQRAADLFMQRATNADDRRARAAFLSYLESNGGYSNLGPVEIVSIVGTVVTAVTSIAVTIYQVVAARNAGWYSWNQGTKHKWLEGALNIAFEQARRSGSRSAADYFWAQLAPCTAKDEAVEEWMNRKGNEWVKPVIAKYEKAYGFGFTEVTPIDLTVYPLVIVAIGAVAAFIVYRIIKKSKK